MNSTEKKMFAAVIIGFFLISLSGTQFIKTKDTIEYSTGPPPTETGGAEIYYLRDDATYDATDTVDHLNTTAPTATRDWTVGPPDGGNYDNDGRPTEGMPGLTLVTGGYDPNYPRQYQDYFSDPMTANTPVKDLNFSIYAMSAVVNADMTLKAEVYDDMTTTYYLKDDGTYNVNDADDILNTTAPTLNRDMLVCSPDGGNYDCDATTKPGLTILRGGYDPAQPQQYQNFTTTAYANDFWINQSFYLSLWVNGSASSNLRLLLSVYDSGATDTLIDDDLYQNTQWPTTWTQIQFTITPTANYRIPAGNKLLFRLERTDNSVTEMYIAYDTTLYPANATIVSEHKLIQTYWPSSTKYYLKDDGAYNANDADDIINTTEPTLNRDLSVGAPDGGDYDADTKPGLTILKGGYDPAYPKQYQNFTTDAYTSDFWINASFTVYVWTQASATANINLKLSAYDSGATDTLIDDDSVSDAQWPTTWTLTQLTIAPTANYKIPAGNKLMLRFERVDVQIEELYLAYDTTSYPANTTITHDYTVYASITHSESPWPYTWYEVVMNISGFDYTMLTGHSFILRLTRTDNSPRNMYLAYDTIPYPSLLQVGNSTGNTNYYLKDDGTYTYTDPTDYLSTTAPIYDRNMLAGPEATPPGGDYDLDSELLLGPGLTLERGGYNVNRPKQFQEWNTTAFTADYVINGDVVFNLSTRATTSKDMTVRASLWNLTGTTYTQIGVNVDYNDLAWSTLWHWISFTFVGISYTIGAESQLVVRIERTDTWQTDYIDVAYDTKGPDAPYPSNLTMPDGTLYYLLDDGTYTADDPYDYLGTTAPTIDRDLYDGPPVGGDFDYDNPEDVTRPGLTIFGPGAPGAPPYTQYHYWEIQMTADTQMGAWGNLTIWVMQERVDTMSVNFTVYNRTADTYTSLGSGEIIGSWSTSNWEKISFNVTITPAIIATGSYLSLKLTRVDSSPYRLYVAYDDTTINSNYRYLAKGDITVDWVETYDTLNNKKDVFNRGETVVIKANVSSTVNAGDIGDAKINITAPNNTLVVTLALMTLEQTDPSTPPLWKIFNYTYVIPSDAGYGYFRANVTCFNLAGIETWHWWWYDFVCTGV